MKKLVPLIMLLMTAGAVQGGLVTRHQSSLHTL